MKGCSLVASSPLRGEALRRSPLEPPAEQSFPNILDVKPLRVELMEALDTIILLLHPITAAAILAWMWWQYGWKRKSRELKGETRRQEIERHEKVGERILIAAIISVMIAFIARWYTGLGLMPGSLHGFTGPLGITLLWITARWGRKSRKDRVSKTKHGRAADLLIALMILHSFLGFLYIFEVL